MAVRAWSRTTRAEGRKSCRAAERGGLPGACGEPVGASSLGRARRPPRSYSPPPRSIRSSGNLCRRGRTMGHLGGKAAVGTGGSRGIGRAIAGALAAEGATVALAARTAEAAQRAAGEIGGRAMGFGCDVRDFDQVKRLFASVAERTPGTDVLINNAGVGVFG